MWLQHPVGPLGECGHLSSTTTLVYRCDPSPLKATFSLGSGYRLGVWDLPRVTNILAVSPLASPSPFLGKGHQLSQTQAPLRAGVGPLPKESMTFEVNVEI